MKIIGIDDEEEKKKVLNHKKIIITAIVATVVLIGVVLFCVYLGNRDFREFTDKYIFMKNVTENNLVSIPIDEGEDGFVYAYDKYICVLRQNTLVGYNKSGNKEFELKVEVSNPIIDVNNRFLAIAEKEGKRIYLISDDKILWDNQIDGSILKISVNKNGYVSVILTGTTNKSVVQIFDSNGKSLFKTYLAYTAVDCDISNDNKNLSIAKVSTNGTLAQTTIETISIPKAKEQETAPDAKLYNIEIESDKVPINLKYQDGNKLVCMFDNSVELIKNDGYEELLKLEEDGKKITYGGIELNGEAFRVIEKNSLLSSETTVEILNTSNGATNMYVFDGTIKEAFSSNSVIALNLGTEVHFIGTNGWLIKKYTSNQEVKRIVINDNFAGIIYRDKVEIVNL